VTAAAAYRGDHRPLVAFAQHVGVAEELLGQFKGIPDRLDGEQVTQDVLDLLKAEARVAWEGLWDHLGQAREIARSIGRDVGAYDEARRIAGDIWLRAIDVDIGPWQRTFSGGRSRAITWRNAPTEPATDAIEALRAVVPEAAVLVASAPPPETDLRRHGWWRVMVAVVVVMGVAWLVLACTPS
jgi:hypothetical protein